MWIFEEWTFQQIRVKTFFRTRINVACSLFLGIKLLHAKNAEIFSENVIDWRECAAIRKHLNVFARRSVLHRDDFPEVKQNFCCSVFGPWSVSLLQGTRTWNHKSVDSSRCDCKVKRWTISNWFKFRGTVILHNENKHDSVTAVNCPFEIFRSCKLSASILNIKLSFVEYSWVQWLLV